MPPSPLDHTYCTEGDLVALLSPDGETGRVDDQARGWIDSVGAGYVQQAIFWATSRVDFYCAAKYATADLATSWVVNNWALVLACDWLSRRRGNPSPFGDMVEEVMQDLKDIRSGEAQFSDIGLRTAAWPAWSNCRVDQLYALRKVRVERVQGMSELTALPGAVNDDLRSRFIIEPY